MDFDETYNVHCNITLDSGRKITLETLVQSRTYAGLMLGAPSKESNDWHLERAFDQARALRKLNIEPYLVPPERRDYRIEPGDMDDVLEQQQDRPPESRHVPEWLPEVECIGVFNSLDPARDMTMDASTLIIIWYQDDFGIDPKAVAQIRTIDWDQHATDWEY